MNIEIVFTLIIISFIIISFIILMFKKNSNYKKIHGPELLTTLGILGTFIGVSYAIYNLSNSKDTISSLPLFISSLQFAFIASTFGVGGAVAIRLIQLFSNESSNISKDAEENNNSGDNSELMILELKKLNKSIVGNEEGSLFFEIKMMRLDMSEKLKSIKTSFDDFSKEMIENNQKAFIEALNNSIKEFNNSLTEQFGENFKQLNIAVGKLLQWQEQYEKQLNQLIETEKQTANDMRESAKAYTLLLQSASVFEKVANDLNLLLPNMKVMTETLFTQTKTLSDVLGTMKDVTPQFAEKIDNMLVDLNNGIVGLVTSIGKVIEEQITNSILHINSGFNSLLTDQRDSLNSHINSIESISNELKQKINLSIENHKIETEKFINEIKFGYSEIVANHNDSIKNFTSTIKSSSVELKDILSNTINDNQRVINKSLDESLTKIREGITVLDKGLEKELTRSLESLGNQLASLSSKFVEDYTPLTEKLRDVVRIAESIKR